EQDGFDIAYLSELDPLWNDDELSTILNPEVFLFTNIIAQAACSADCVSASANLALDKLFWCAGCQGSMYPLSGSVAYDNSHLQAALLLVQRMTYKLQREGLLWQVATDENSEKLCKPQYAPILKKSTYRSQMTYPVRGKGEAFGKSTALWGAGKEFPVQGEHFNFLLFRKRNCCAF
ncbi:MAG: TraU family protein, partial [Gammaproteobacteria bacterium]